MSEKQFFVGDIKIDGIEPTKEFKEYAEKERNGTLTEKEKKDFANVPHTMKKTDNKN